MKNVLFYDRVKEQTHITGSSPFLLEGAMPGFSAFSDFLSSGDVVFYAATDGQDYEVGSGTYIGAHVASTTTLLRDPVRSSNGNNLVSFSAGIKEVYATYPGAFAVVSNPEDTPQETRESGVAFWTGAQTLDHNSSFVWDDLNSRLGVNRSSPDWAIDVGGDNYDSKIRVSGIILGASGIDFVNTPVGFNDGIQKEPFRKNTLCEATSGVLELSGDVNETICFKNQVAGTFLGVPSGVCPAECADDHPVFRTLQVSDIPDLSGLYITEYAFSDFGSGNIGFYTGLNKLAYSDSFRIDTTVSPNELIVSGELVFPDADDSRIIGSYLAGTGLELNGDQRTFNMAGSGQLDRLELRYTEGSNQLVSNSGVDNNPQTEVTVINESGFLSVPFRDTVTDITTNFPPSIGSIFFASSDSYIMIGNGTNWVSGQLF